MGYSAVTSMTLSYDYPETTSVTVTKTTVTSNPSTTWLPDTSESFSFSGKTCDNIKITGLLKDGSPYKHKYEMTGTCTKDNIGRIISGKVKGFHEA